MPSPYQVENFETRVTEFLTSMLEPAWDNFLDELRSSIVLQSKAIGSYECFLEVLQSQFAGAIYHECLQLSFHGCETGDTLERQLREDFAEVKAEFG